jgi:hypothetical protein
MEYLDFEIEITSAVDGGYGVRVLRSPAGEATGTMRLSLESMQVGERIEALQTALLRSGVSGHALATPEAQTVEQFGKELWAALFTGDVLVAFEVSRDRAKQSGRGMRLKLRVASAELAALPWEYLYDAGRGDYLSVYTATPLVRYVPLQKAIEPLLVTLPLRILAMVASPSDYPALDVEHEKKRLESATAKLTARGLVELVWLEGQTPQDLLDALQQPPWHVFHFIGHGGFDPERGEGVILLADDSGASLRVAGTALGRLLGDHFPLRLAVLNSCDGARGDEADVFSSTAAALVRLGTPAVVAMQYQITDEAAILFSRYFYHAIAGGMPVDAAVAEARKGIALTIPNTLEWGTPVLFMRAPDGVLFSVPAPVVPLPLPEPEPEPEPVPEPEPLPEPVPEPEPEPVPEPVPEPEPEPVPEPEPEPKPEPEPRPEPEPQPPLPPPVPAPQAIVPQPEPVPPRRRWRRWVAIGVGILVALVVIGLLLPPPDLPGRIAYATGSGITTVAPDGSDPRPVAGTGPGDTEPTWSPDAASIAYANAFGLWSVPVSDGGIEAQLFEGNLGSPDWSPDGSTIAFASDHVGGTLQIYLLNPADASNPVPLLSSGIEEHDPTWSPDGSMIAFVSGVGDERELAVFHPTSGATLITSNAVNDVDPAWSPDGESIVFASATSGSFDIWKMRVDGSEVTQLTSGPGDDHDPAWSPDGRAIAFTRREGGAPQIYVLMLETGEELQITSGDAGADQPTWR